MRSLVAGPGPEAGVSRSEELGEESRRSAPEHNSQVEVQLEPERWNLA